MTTVLKYLTVASILFGFASIAKAALPDPGMEIVPGATALVITDPQNDFLSPEGVTWGVVGNSVEATYGNRSRQELSRLIFGEDVSVEIQVVDRYGRPVGRPVVENMDVTEEMVRTGAAWVYRTYSDDENLYALEREAKANRQGIWGLDEYERVPPWDWRQGKRNASTSESPAEPFQCGIKTYCREMVSCDEARFHLRQCGLTRLDGDGDGVPCEALCR